MKKELNHIIQLLESKDHLINKLDLTDQQKARLIDLFKKHPNLESKIDWNNKNLTWEDFSEVIGSEGKSRNQARKKGLTGLKENEDYKILEQNENYTVYYPMTHLASKTLADKVSPEGVVGRWCISDNNAAWWNKYTSNGTDFFFIFTNDDKYAVARTPNKRNWVGSEDSVVVFNADDAELSPNEVQNLFNFPPFGNGLAWKPVEETLPYQLNAKYPYNPDDWFKVFPSGKYSKSGNKLISLNIDQPEIRIEPGTEIVAAQDPRERNTTVQKLTIPSSVNSIGPRAFMNLANLTSVILPDTCFIDEAAFMGCVSLTEVGTASGQWPDRELPTNVFFGCRNLTRLPLSDNVRYIGMGAFSRTGDRIPELIIPDSVETIKPLAFSQTKFKIITLPPHVIDWSQRVFEESEVETLNINGQMLIPSGAFRSCTKLKTITGWNKDQMTSIEEQAFAYCNQLTELDFSEANGVYIEGQAFSNCTALKSVKLPSRTALTWNVFQGCINLKDVYFAGPKSRWETCMQNLEKILGKNEVVYPVSNMAGGISWKNASKKGLLYAVIHCTDGDFQWAIAPVQPA